MDPVHISVAEVTVPVENSLTLAAGSRNARSKPYGAWLLLLCIFIFIFRQNVLERGRVISLDLSAVDSFAAIDITVVFLAAFVLIFSGRLWQAWSAIRPTPAVWMFWYYMFCAASFIWSTAAIYSLYRASEYLVFFFATCAVVVQYQDFIGAERAFLRATAAVILLQMSRYLRGGGSISLDAWHTTTYSASAAILFCYCLGEYLAMTKADRSADKGRTRRLLRFGIFAFGPLALGTSAGSNIAVAVGCSLIFLALRRFGLLLAVGFIGLLLAILGGGQGLVHSLLLPGKDEYAVETASGRTLVWELYWRKFLQSPVLGYGFAIISGGRDKAFVAHSHNSFFSALLGTGSVGFALFGLFTVRLWWTTIGKVWRRGPGTVGSAGALAAAFVNCLTLELMADAWCTNSLPFVWLLVFFLFHVRGSRQIAGASSGVQPTVGGTA
jgi:hypothetical protein